MYISGLRVLKNIPLGFQVSDIFKPNFCRFGAILVQNILKFPLNVFTFRPKSSLFQPSTKEINPKSLINYHL